MKCFTRVSLLLSTLAVLAMAPLYAADSDITAGRQGERSTFWQGYSAGMSDQEYRNTYRANQRDISKYIASYSENALLSLGVPQGGIRLMGAAAGLAIKHDATLYLGDSHFLVLDLQNVTDDNRAVTFGIKFDW